MPALPSGRRRTNGRSGCASRQTIVTPTNTADHWLQVFIATQAASEPIMGRLFLASEFLRDSSSSQKIDKLWSEIATTLSLSATYRPPPAERALRMSADVGRIHLGN